MFLRFFLLFVLAMLALRAAGRFMGGLSQGARHDERRPRGGASPVKMAKDPVCGTFVVPGKAISAVEGGDTVWFCSERCRDAFAAKS